MPSGLTPRASTLRNVTESSHLDAAAFARRSEVNFEVHHLASESIELQPVRSNRITCAAGGAAIGIRAPGTVEIVPDARSESAPPEHRSHCCHCTVMSTFLWTPLMRAAYVVVPLISAVSRPVSDIDTTAPIPRP